MKTSLKIIGLLVGCAGLAAAQEITLTNRIPEPVRDGDLAILTPNNFDDLGLEQLARVKIDIASIHARPLREQPGIVSVIEASEIRETGARDLTDILQLVPGFGLGQDVNGVIGPSFRGLWAYEGKLQLIVDGVEFNETLYGTTQLGHHFPADAIAEVEIIRGPGSAKYGGTAELAVIRVTTKGATQNGGYGSMTSSFTDGKIGMDYTGGFGYLLGDWRVSANAFVGENFRSNRRYTAQSGTNFDMTHASDIQSRMVNVGIGWKNLDVRFIYDLYQLDDRIGFGEPLPQIEPISFETFAVVANYNWEVNDWLTVTPSFTYRRQMPWCGGLPGATVEEVTDRYIGELTAVANLSASSTLLAGFRYHRDDARAVDTLFYATPPDDFYQNGTSDYVAYDSFSPYTQLDWDLDWVNLTVGGRYEHHSAVGGQFVPRIGLTKAWERFHVKLLYDQAYRTPNINILAQPLAGDVEPENTTSYQLELGYQFNRGWSLTENFFYMEIKDPIYYSSLLGGGSNDGYSNGKKISTYGTEIELRYQHKKFTGTMSYSMYVLGQNSLPTYDSGNPQVALGLPAHKIAASGTWHILDNLSWNVNGTLTALERAYTDTSVTAEELNPTFLLNTFIEYRWKHASLGVGLANLLDQDNPIAQPYDGKVAPMLLKGRELFVKLGIEF